MEETNFEYKPNTLLLVCEPYIKKKYIYLCLIIILTILISLIQTIGISSIISNILRFIGKNNIKSTFLNLNYLIAICVLHLFLLFLYKDMQHSFLTNFVHDIRTNFFEYILTLNNIELFRGNLTDLGGQMDKLSINANYAFWVLTDDFIPDIAFIFIIFIYLTFNNFTLGIMYLIGNFLIIYCYILALPSLIEDKIKYRDCNDYHQSYIDDIYLNIEKVVYSGTTDEEIKKIKKITKKCSNLSINYSNNYMYSYLCINILSYVTMCSIIWYSITLKFKNNLNVSVLFTIITMILIYRERISKISTAISDFIEAYVKIIFIENKMTSMVDNTFNEKNNFSYMNKYNYVPVNLNFNTIQFKNVNFSYDDDKVVLDNFNETINCNSNKIIGITGKSGTGKSSLVKMIIKLYNNYDGDIFIDDTNIKDIDPTYIRNNITYIHQNGILLDRLVMDNIMYGCANKNLCEEKLNIIMSYKSIKEIFKNIDIYGNTGKLGQSLSGGQRQVINIINGLIKPTRLLIIDEPTNALDPNLKKEIIGIINDFKKYKQSIIIITHDKDVQKIMDEVIQI